MHPVTLYQSFGLIYCFFLLLAYFVRGAANQHVPLFTNCITTNTSRTIYDFSAYDIRDDEEENLISLSKYKGKTLVIVNTATYCGYTMQYPHFNKLKDHYSSGNFEILGFPCNQFLLQEPGDNGKEILNGLRYVRPGNGYEANFPLFKRGDINGRNEQPLYTFLKSVCPSPVDEFQPWPKITYTPMRSRDIRWNFAKFLIDPNGRPVKHFTSAITPAQLRSHIDAVMATSGSNRRYENVYDDLFDDDDTSQ